jgi:hypothetical protein
MIENLQLRKHEISLYLGYFRPEITQKLKKFEKIYSVNLSR